MRLSRRRLALPALVAAVLVTGVTAQRTLARLTDQDSSAASFATDIFAPPTGLAATGGLGVNLTWTPTVDAYASGYEVYRTTTSGSGYALVATVTPGSASSTTDSPGIGLFYYVLRSSFQNWRSVNSNETSATVALGPTATGFKMCAGQAPDTGGNGNGYETNPANACADDGVNAADVNTGSSGHSATCANAANDRHRFRDFSLGLPGSVALVSGIQVRADVGMNNNGGTSRLCVELSWNGGTSWTAAKFVTLSGSAVAQYNVGGILDTWGRVWTASDFSNANFRVRLTDATTQPNKDYLLDYVAVQVSYTP